MQVILIEVKDAGATDRHPSHHRRRGASGVHAAHPCQGPVCAAIAVRERMRRRKSSYSSPLRADSLVSE